MDLLISNSDSNKVSVSRLLQPMVPEDDHHPALEVSISLPNVKFLIEKRKPKTNYYRADYVKLNESLLNIDWSNELNNLNIDEAVIRFYEILDPFIQSIPKTKVSVRDYPVYYTHDLILLIEEKSKVKIKLNKSKCVVEKAKLKAKFSDLRKQVKHETQICFDNYASDCEEKIKTNSKCFFSFTKSLNKTNSLPNNMSLANESSNERQGICNLFAKFFGSVFNQNVQLIQPNEVIYDPFYEQEEILDILPDISFTTSQVQDVLKGFNIHKVASPDNIPMFFFVNLSLSLGFPLCILFNKSLTEKKFPNKWKESFVSPIFKKGDKSDITNYRAVCIMCAASKIFEKLMFIALFELIKDKIHKSQHGFFSKRSTHSNLMEYISNLSREIVDGGQVDSVYTDFTKAFDTVDHWRLLFKLKLFGFNENQISWFWSYIRDRSQYVVIGSAKSDRITPNSGVPQGSILGPLLFIIFINDLLTSLEYCSGFADDLKVYRTIACLSDCFKLQRDLIKIDEWCIANKMSLNIDKCAIISITYSLNRIEFPYYFGNELIKRVSSVKDLGVIIDEKLRFKEHISNITRKAYRMLGFIFRCGKYFAKQSTMLTLYKSLVRSNLEYCSVIWNPFYGNSKDQIERVQRKFTRFFYFKFKMVKPEYNVRLEYLNIHSLESRRLETDEITLQVNS